MSTAETYDAAVNAWTPMPAMQTRRSGVSCIAYHGCLYVIGGFNGLQRMNSGERFDPVTGRWTPVVDMSNPRSNFAVEVLDDMIFVAGGFNGVTTIAQVECYNDRTDEWCALQRSLLSSAYFCPKTYYVHLKMTPQWYKYTIIILSRPSAVYLQFLQFLLNKYQ